MSKIHITLVGGQPIPVYLGTTNNRQSKARNCQNHRHPHHTGGN